MNKFIIKPNTKLNLSKISTSDTGEFKSKKDVADLLKNNIKKMIEL